MQSLLELGFARVIIVNDGSEPRCNEIFDTLAQTDGCIVLHHEVNQGKGAGLKTALTYCLAHYGDRRFKCAVMVDADGQHAVDDVCQLATRSHDHPDSYALGIRDFNLPVVPARSRFGNRLTSGAFHVLYGRYLRDTQTGLRAVPVCLWNWAASVEGERFEYETNCLIQAVKNHIPMTEVPIQTLYFDDNAGTHFRPMGDSLPIMRCLFGNMGTYALSGALAALATLVAFYLVDQVWLRAMAPAGRILAASVIAAVVASVVRFLLHLVFSVRTQRSARNATGKYYLLVIVQMLASYLVVLGVHLLMRWPALWVKVVADFVLIIVGYQIHPRWLFSTQK